MMSSSPGQEVNRPQRDSCLPALCALWTVDLQLTHVDCSPADTLVHFQGQYLTVCEMDYNILQVEIQNAQKTAVTVDLAGLYLVEDALSGCWYRGRVQNRRNDLYDVFLVDCGTVLTVDASHLASASSEIFMLPPKIVCGFFANILPSRERWDDAALHYFPSLIGTSIKGSIHAFLPHKVMILEVSEVNQELVKRNLGRNVDRDTFLVLVEILIQVPLKQKNKPTPDFLMEKQVGQELSLEPFRVQNFENVFLCFRPKLSVGGKYRARITAAVKPSLFFCQLTSVAEDLKDMAYNLSLCCESNTEDPPGKLVGNTGLLCAVRGKDEKWYRGLVQCLPVNSRVQVLFIDYGFCEYVKVENIYQLPPRFFSFPFMAFPCILSCISEPDVDVQKDQLNLFKKALLGSMLDVHIDNFNRKDNLYIVTLICSVGNEDSGEFQKSSSSSRQVTCTANTVLYDKSKIPLQHGCIVQYTDEFKKVESLENLDSVKGIKEKPVFRGIVEHVLNPSDFWLRTVERNCEFEDMTQKLKQYFTALPLDAGILKNPVPGEPCCAMYEKDLLYYRAVVKKVLKHGAEVCFIDFGNTENVPYMFIKKLPLDFTGEPAFALNCSLAHVVPVGDVWTVSVNDYFRKAVLNKVLAVRVVHKHKDKMVVELREGVTRETINVQMVKAELAVAMGASKTIRPASFLRQKPNIFQKSTPATKVRGVSRNVKKSSERRNTWNVVAVENGGSRTTATVTKTDKGKQVPADVIVFKRMKFSAGSELPVQCCHISSPSEFWCQPKSQSMRLNRLMAEMQEYYEKHEDALEPNEACCVVKRVEDGRWYRGCIVGNDDDDDKVSVILVDFGIVLKEKWHKLRAVKAEYYELEGQAFRCSFYSLIEPAEKYPNVWSAEANSLLKYFVGTNSKNLRCTVHTVMFMKCLGLFNIVELHTPCQSATSFLVVKGVARKVNHSEQRMSSAVLLSYVFSMFDVKIGSTEAVCITHVCSQWEFYCQLERNGQMLKNLMEKVRRISSKMLCEKLDFFDVTLCLAKYLEDGQWYRGLAFPVQSRLHLNVLFVDYGNMHVVEKRNVLPIPRGATDLHFVPMQALRCRLLGVPKGDIVMEVTAFLKKAALNTLLQAKFVGTDEDGTLVCELFDGNLHLSYEVRKLLATRNKTFLAREPNPRCSKPINGSKENVTFGKNRSQSQSHFAIKKFKSFKTESSRSSTGCHRNKLERVVSRALRWSGSSVGEKCQSKEARSPLRKQVGNVTLAKLSHLPEVEIKAEFREVAFVSHVNSATDFHVQMKNDEPTILEICEQLNSRLFRENAKCVTGPVDAGDLIAAKYEEDGVFYRSVVTDVSGHLTVEFIDYGNVAVVEKRDVLMLTGTFLTHPRLSIHCSLEKLQGCGDDELLQALVTDKPLLIQFVRRCGSQWTVKIEGHDENAPPVNLPEVICSSGEVKEIVCGLSRNEIQTGDGSPAVEGCWANMQGVEILQECDGALRNNSVTQMKSERSTNVNHVKAQLSGKDQVIPTSEQLVAMQSAGERPRVPRLVFLALSHLPGGEQASIPHQNVIPGQNEEGKLLSVLENGDFAIRLNKNKETFALLVQLLERNMPRSHMVSVVDNREGLECLAKSSTNQWCRAMVQEVFPSQGSCSVLFLDHGTTEVVSLDCVKELCTELRQVPMQAVICRLNASTGMVNETCEILREVLTASIGQAIKLVFVSYSETSQRWMVEVMVDGVLLFQQLKHRESIMEQGESSLKGDGNHVQDCCADPGPVPQLSVAPVEKEMGHRGLAVAVVDPYEFHIILEEYLLTRNIISAALENISEDVSSLPEAHLIPRACCLVRSGTRKKWHRAEILHVDKSSVVLSLVDYGYCVHVPYVGRRQLRQLPEKLLRIPKLARRCALRGVRPSGEDRWSDEAVVFFQEHMCESNLMIYCRQCISEAQWEVDVVSQGVNVATVLVDAGHATHIDSLLGLRFQQQTFTTGDSLQEGVLRKLNTDTTDLFVLFKPREDQALPRRLAEDNRDSLDDPEVEGGRSQRDETAVLMRDAAIASDDSPAKVASYSFQDKLIYR